MPKQCLTQSTMRFISETLKKTLKCYKNWKLPVKISKIHKLCRSDFVPMPIRWSISTKCMC